MEAFVANWAGLGACADTRQCVRPRGTPVARHRQWVRCCAPETGTSRTALLKEKAAKSNVEIRVVASDVDGTLLNTKHELPARVAEVIVEMMDSGVAFFPATGKSRTGALNSFGEPLVSRLGWNSPGVYLQGLLVYGSGGKLIYERCLDASVVTEAVTRARELDCPWVAYSGDEILCEKTDAYVECLTQYHEPKPLVVPDLLEQVQQGARKVNKVLLIATEQIINQLRPVFDEMLGDHATLTQAQVDMLEILPFGASKGAGVNLLLEHLGFSNDELLAMGDAENDLEMLKSAAIGCAMGNALPSVKAVADVVVATNNEGGVAEAIQAFVMRRRAEQN